MNQPQGELTADRFPKRWAHLIAVAALLAAFSATGLLVLSRSNPWFIGEQHEPRWSWAIGSGRLKLWVAEPGAFPLTGTWASSWYRGLDGQPIRWDFTVSRGSTGGVLVIAIPLWAIAAGFFISGAGVLWSARRSRVTPVVCETATCSRRAAPLPSATKR